MDFNNIDWGSTAGSLSYQPTQSGALNSTFPQPTQSATSGLGIYNKAFNLTGSGNQYTPDKSLGGTKSLGGNGFESYMKPDLAIPHINANDMMAEYNKQKAASYNKDQTVKADSDFGSQGRTDGLRKEMWGGTSQDWSKMSADKQMGVVNAGFTLAGLVGNLFTH